MGQRQRISFSELQQAMYTRLTTDLVGTDVAERVWDSPPQDTKLPLVLIGDGVARPNEAKGTPILDFTIQLDVYSDDLGMLQVQSIANDISVSLTKSQLVLANNFNCFDVRMTSCELLREYDGVKLIRRALMTFLCKVEDLSY